MDSTIIKAVRCPQCGNLSNKSITPLTKEHSIECRVCGYQEIETIKSVDVFKGYGALLLNETAVLFHEPIPFEKEQEILKTISENPNASFFKWSDEFGLTVLKGELPLSEEEEIRIKEMLDEQQYYSLIGCNVSHGSIF